MVTAVTFQYGDYPVDQKCAKVKKCGVRIEYEKDLEDIQLRKEQYSNQSSAEIEDMNQDSATDRSITNGPLSKAQRLKAKT
ncbi:hypothetical protein V6N13_014317 [Hibiscus sabdariffa]